MIKKSIFLILFSSLLFYAPFFLNRAYDGCNLRKLAFSSSESTTYIKPESLDNVLSQNFSYLSRGNQSFAFVSDDGQYIIKFFRHGGWIHPWRKWIRSKIFSPNRKRFGIENLIRQLSATKEAYEKASDLTGLIYVHLSPTDSQLSTVLFKDSIGRSCQLDLDKHLFAVQHRAIPFEVAYAEAIKAKDREKFENLTVSFISLLKSRTARGIKNTDTKLIDNFGFIGQQAIEWDFGGYKVDESLRSTENQRIELSFFSSKAELFFRVNYPDWSDEYNSIIQKVL